MGFNHIMTAPFPACIYRPRRRSATVIKLIKYDGGVMIYDRPIKALELMKEFPKHMVCRSDCFYIGQRTPALSHHDRLQPGHNYFLLPANFFQSALSFATFLRCRSSLSGRPPFEVEKTPSGSLRIKVTEEMIMQHKKEEETEIEKIIRVCTTPQLRKEYEQLVVRRHHWKPKLDTIMEKSSRQKRKDRKKKTVHVL